MWTHLWLFLGAAVVVGVGAFALSEVPPPAKAPDAEPKPAGAEPSVPATPAEIARWVAELGSNRFPAREEAMTALARAGAPALAPLAEAAKSGNPEVRRRAAELIDRIEANQALAPTWVTLQLRDVPVPEAVEALARQCRVRLELMPQQGPAREQLEGKRITLEPGRVPFWDALERLCQAGGLTYTSRTAKTLELQPADGAPRPPTAVSGAFRLRVTGMNYARSLNLNLVPGTTPARSESMNVSIDVLCEPHVALLAIGAPQFTEATEEEGRNALSGAPAGQGYTRNPYYHGAAPMQPLVTSVPLRPSTRPAAKLITLKGNLPVEVLGQRKPLLVVDDILNTKEKVFKGEGDLVLMFIHVQDQAGGRNGQIRFALSGLEKSQPVLDRRQYGDTEAYRPHFEVTDAAGNPLQLSLSLNQQGGERQDRGVLDGGFYYSAQGNTGPAARFVFHAFKRFHANIPFEFRDVPMP